MNEFAALEPINYEQLVLNPRNRCPLHEATPSGPIPLLEQCCTYICRQGGSWCSVAVCYIPVHLAETLLAEAIRLMEPTAVAAIIANWPLRTLCFREVLHGHQYNLFETEMGLDLMVFKGITDRTPKCKIRTLDLRGLKLNVTFTKLIVQMWPMLSLRKSQRNVKTLTNIVLREAGLKKDNKLAQEIIPKLIKDFLSHDVVLNRYTISLSRGEKMLVKIDKVQFSTQNTFFMDYLITNCLRNITPVTVTAANIIIKSELNIGDEILDSLAPFIVFRGQNLELLDGIWLQNLEDNVFFIVQQDIIPFTHITGLGLQNCNISLQEGRTRRRTQARFQLTATLSAFSNLTRLDVSQNCFAGVLQEIGEALTQNLVYLNIRECDLLDRDIEYLAGSRHGSSLQHLNMSRICGLFPEDDFAVSCSTLVASLDKFVNISVLHIQQNQITDARVGTLCHCIKNCWPKLRSLNVLDNILSTDAAMQVVAACAGVPHMQLLKLPYAHNMLEGGNLLATGRTNFEQTVKCKLKSVGREDMKVDIHNLAYAILVQITRERVLITTIVAED